MTTTAPMTPLRATRGHRVLLLAASISTALLITLGGIVCATGTATACPDWPGCYGRIVPPPRIDAIIEYTHRFVAAITSPLIIAAAVVGWRRARLLPWVRRPPLFAIPFLLAVVVFGALAVLTGLPPGWAAVDLGSALLVLALVVTAATAARSGPVGSNFRRTRLGLAALLAVYVTLVSAVLVAGKGSLTRCLGWPLWRVLSYDLPGWPQIARLVCAGTALLLLAAVVIRTWRGQPRGSALHRTATALVVLMVVELAAGLWMLAVGYTLILLAVAAAAATGLWAGLVRLVILALTEQAS